MGSVHKSVERLAATNIASLFGIPLHIISVRGLPEMSKGEITGRNSFLIFTALVATQKQRNLLGIGIHSGPPYFDCSVQFFSTVSQLVSEHTDGRVSLIAPFLHWTKKEVYRYFMESRLPISKTYSCEVGTAIPCGSCASCKDREALGCSQNVGR